MAWTVELNAEYGFIHTVFSGPIRNRDSNKAIEEALALAPGDGPHMFLTDVLNATSRLSVWDIYDIPAYWEDLGANRANRLALVVPAGGRMWEDAMFYENVCRNRGWQVTVFPQIQEAVAWLNSP